jgi:hypothetical protein
MILSLMADQRLKKEIFLRLYQKLRQLKQLLEKGFAHLKGSEEKMQK